MPTINNRIIKFRIWSPGGKKMFVPKFTYPDVDKTCDWVMMEFTGLLDKNSREIYEGDIVKFHYFGFDGNETDNLGIGHVNYSNCCGYFYIEFLNLYKEKVHLLFTETSHFEEPCIEVVGNIFENLELLK